MVARRVRSAKEKDRNDQLTEPALHGGEELIVPRCLVFPLHLNSNAELVTSNLEKAYPSLKKHKVAVKLEGCNELATERSTVPSLIDGGKNHVVQPETL